MAANAAELVLCSLEAWDDVWRRNQFLVRELLELHPGLRVLFVEPPMDLLHTASRRPRRPGRGPQPIAGFDRLWRLRPVKVLPRVVGPFADRSLVHQVRRAATELGFVAPTLWVNDSTYAALTAEVSWPSVYDITDDWLLAGSLAPRELARLRGRENLLLRWADAVVVCSPALAASRGAVREVVLIPNGVDADHFRAPRPRPDDLPAAPCAVYVGTVHEDRLDVELCRQLSSALPDVQLVLVGPVASRGAVERLGSLPNVHLLGSRAYCDVPAYLQHADVIVVPHRITPFTDSLDPIKAYECLAVDTPVVATPVAGFRNLNRDVELGCGREFVDAVRAAVERPENRRRTRTPPTWKTRAAQFADVLDDVRASSCRRPRTALRVAFVDHCARISGAQVALLRLLPELDDVEAHVVLAEHGPLVPELEAAGIRVRILPMDERLRGLSRHGVTVGVAGVAGAYRTCRYVSQLARHLRALDADLIHTNSLKAALYGGAAGRLAGIPVLWHVRDRIAEDYLPRSAVLLVRSALRLLPDAVIVNSRSTEATLGSFLATGALPHAVIHDPAPACPMAHRPAPARPLRVGVVGRIAPWKGQDLFLSAFARAFPHGLEQAVVIGAPLFGEDDFEACLHRQADQLGIGSRVEFRGFRSDVPAELARLDVLVHSSVIPEPFGLVVVEGMAAGLVVVVADAGGPAEVVTHGVDGILYRMADEEALADALADLASRPELRRRMGGAASSSAARFLPPAIAAQVRAFYESAVPAVRRSARTLEPQR